MKKFRPIAYGEADIELARQNMTESQIEKASCLYAKSRGCLCYKFTSQGRAGVPDRIILIPNGKCIFIEFKKPKGKLSALQVNEHRVIHKHGHKVFVAWSFIEAKKIIDEQFNDNL